MKIFQWILPILLLLTNSKFSAAQFYCNQDDSIALERLSIALGLTGLPVKPWSTVAPPSEWYGIDTIHSLSATNEYRITKIDLSNQANAIGNIPDTLFNNDQLHFLDTLLLGNIGFLNFGDTICKQTTGTAPKLRYIDISNNDFTSLNLNVFVHLLTNMDNLNAIKMDNCAFGNPLKSFSISSSTSLIALNINNCIMPSDTLQLDSLLKYWVNLTFLYAKNDSISAISTSILYPGSLQKLQIENNLIQQFADIKNALITLTNLKWLYASAAMDISNLNDLSLNLPALLPNLKHIDLSYNNFFGPFPAHLLEKLLNIEIIYINNNLLHSKLPIPSGTINTGPLSGFLAYSGTRFLKELNIQNNRFYGTVRLDWLFNSQFANNLLGNGTGMPLEYLNFGQNYFKEIGPRLNDINTDQIINSLLSQRFASLNTLIVHQNAFDFKDLYRLARICRLKLMTPNLITHFVPQMSTDTSSFFYAPQSDLGIGGIRRQNPNKRILFSAGKGIEAAEQGVTNFLSNKYRWERRDTAGLAGGTSGNPVTQFLGQTEQVGGSTTPNLSTDNSSGLAQTDQTYLIGIDTTAENAHMIGVDNLDSAKHNNWLFRAQISNKWFSELIIYTKFKKIEVGMCTDNSGAPVHCQNMIIQFDPAILASLTPFEQDSMKIAVREEMGATPLEVCLCGDIELWDIADTAYTMLDAFGKGTKLSTSTASAKPQLLSSDPNYSLLSGTVNNIPDTSGIPTGPGNTTAKTLVAIIDSGVDYQYPALTPYLSEGASTTSTCMPNALWGYNFLEDNNDANDDHGHGTTVAGIIAGISQESILPDTGSMATDIGILPLKYTDKNGNGSLFHAACAMRYAADYERNISGGTATVRVINTSWGYYGDPCILLENAITYIGEDCGILLVASAGNDGTVVEGADSLRHWPSNSIWDTTGTLNIDNVIGVAGVDQSLNSLDINSNWGSVHIDIAAPWNENSTQAGSVNGYVSVEGTSFAAPQVSRAAALLFDKYPDATYYAVKYALMNGVDILQSPDSLKILSRGRVNYYKADSILSSLTDRTLCSPYTAVDKINIGLTDDYIRIYPNPVNDNLTIELDYRILSDDIELFLYNISGQLLKHKILEAGTTNNTLSTKDIPSGIYLLNFILTDRSLTKKIIKQ